MNNTSEVNFEKKVFSKLSANSISNLNASELEHVKQNIVSLCESGWLVSEVARYLNCTEEINPEMDEDKAIARMKSIRNEVTKRLKC